MIARKLIKVASERDVMAVREAGLKLAKAVGFEGAELTQIATAISDIARNIFTYAREGAIEISTIEEGVQTGIEVIARDEGPGDGTMVTSRTWLKS
jgi:serine/threonine-protein kinase RsbT